MTKTLASVLALALGCMGVCSSAIAQRAAAPGVVVVAPSPELDALVLANMHVNRYTVQTLATPAQNIQEWSVQVALGAHTYVLDLRPHSVRADDFRVRVQGADGVLREVEPPAITTMKGEVRGMPGSSIRGSLVAGGADLIVTLDDGSLWGVQPQALLDAAAAPGEHIVYDNRDAVEMPGECGGAIVGPGAVDEPPQDVFVPRGGLTRICEVAFDADVEYYVLNGSSVPNTVNDIESIMNAVEGIYENNTGVTYEVTEIVVRTAEPDPYSSNDSGTILDTFRTTWLGSTFTPIRRDTAHMMTGKDMGGVLGIAYLSGICTNVGYGVSRSRWSTNTARRVAVTAHEIGHNFSAGHCNQDAPCNANPISQCQIMCSAIQGCSTTITSFSACEAGVIETYADGRTCLAQQQPSITAPFSDAFPSATIDVNKWVYNKGVTSTTTGVGEPSAANSLEIDCAGSGLYQDDDIRTHFIVMTGVSTPVLQYWVQARGPANGEQLFVDVWTSQLRWVNRNTLTSDGVDDPAYTQHTHTLSGVELHAEFRVRFRTAVDATGDNWFIDDVYAGTNGGAPTGSCCISGVCTVTTQVVCGAGTWTVNGTCTPNPCSQPTGACCYPQGFCFVIPQAQCLAELGTFSGVGTTCNPNNCPQPTGACCYPQGFCFVIPAAQCSAEGGEWQGGGTTCTPNDCPQPAGACCFTDGNCQVLTADDCDGLGGAFQGVGEPCDVGTCPAVTGACCVNSTCIVVSLADCNTQGGLFQGLGSVCGGATCSAPTGACCTGAICVIVSSASCNTQGGIYIGNGAACNAPGDNTQPCCRADFDGDDTVGVPDIFAFLSAWFAASATADIDGDGIGVPDIFAFLSLWFAGGCI